MRYVENRVIVSISLALGAEELAGLPAAMRVPLQNSAQGL
jgi:hypothetical protein